MFFISQKRKQYTNKKTCCWYSLEGPHNIRFHGEIKKIFIWILLTVQLNHKMSLILKVFGFKYTFFSECFSLRSVDVSTSLYSVNILLLDKPCLHFVSSFEDGKKRTTKERLRRRL